MGKSNRSPIKPPLNDFSVIPHSLAMISPIIHVISMPDRAQDRTPISFFFLSFKLKSAIEGSSTSAQNEPRWVGPHTFVDMDDGAVRLKHISDHQSTRCCQLEHALHGEGEGPTVIAQHKAPSSSSSLLLGPSRLLSHFGT